MASTAATTMPRRRSAETRRHPKNSASSTTMTPTTVSGTHLFSVVTMPTIVSVNENEPMMTDRSSMFICSRFRASDSWNACNSVIDAESDAARTSSPAAERQSR
eukprot:Amastigsp_a344262_11.p3 type:complete len:104 gc:universal Amastigsp_a344262_11:152-463(+)